MVEVSSLFETAAVGGPDQGDYLNAVTVVETVLDPRSLLDALLEIERAMGRTRTVRWGPRSIDLDLLFHGESEIDEPGLRVPHPRLHERRFVLDPLLEVWEDRVVQGRALSVWRASLVRQELRRLDGPAWAGHGRSTRSQSSIDDRNDSSD